MVGERGQYLDIPARIRSFVYVVGMLGFPVVVAAYLLVIVSGDLRGVEKSLGELATRIDERPMGLDRTTDFVIYVCESLRHELKSGLPELLETLHLETPPDRDSVVKNINRIDRIIDSYVRPIVRKHQRFASRFPTVGGNLGSFFILSAPAEDIVEGDTEAYLTGEVTKDFGESLNALLMNNFVQFGHANVDLARKDRVDPSTRAVLGALLGMSSGEFDREDKFLEPEENSNNEPIYLEESANFMLMDKNLLLELSKGAIDTAVTGLQDQILQKVRLQSTDTNSSS